MTGTRDARASRTSAASAGADSLTVGLVVLAEHRDGADWRPTELSAGQAVLEMIAHTVPARIRPEASLEALERAVASAVVWKGERGEARDLARRLLSTGEKGAR